FLTQPPPPPRSTLFPYTTLFRSAHQRRAAVADAGLAVLGTGADVAVVTFGVGRAGESRPGPGSQQQDEGKQTRKVSHWHGSPSRSEEHTSELQSRFDLVCRLLLE